MNDVLRLLAIGVSSHTMQFIMGAIEGELFGCMAMAGMQLATRRVASVARQEE